MSSGELQVGQVLLGKRILFTGVTGFVGKVSLSMLLHRYGEQLGKVYVLVRKGSSPSAEDRFFDKVALSEPFLPLREKMGAEGALEFIRHKCDVLDGDITDDFMGLSEEQLAQLSGQVDLIINCAGLVSFNPSLELSLKVNTYGVQNVVNTCLRWNVPLVHMSTAFVAGNRSGLVFEDEEVVGFFPRKDEWKNAGFSLQTELTDNEKLLARLREAADDATQTSQFRQKAIERLEAEGRDANDERTLRLAIARERKLWLNGEFMRAGMERAAHWGWPNTYTYTKSLGEQVIAQSKGLRYALVRPSIVESALHFPFPGWNEGFTTSAPLAFSGIQRPGDIPAGEKAILDIIPVDLVSGALIAAAANTLAEGVKRVFHLASGDSNPFWASRSVELVGLYRRRHYRKKASGNALWNQWLARIEPQPVSKRRFEATSAPLFSKGAQWLKNVINDVQPSWGAPSVSALLSKATETLDEVQQEADALNGLVDLFLPFLWENRYVFRCDNTRSLYENMAKEDAALIPWAPEKLDWRTYFLEVHLPGLEKWVFPGLEEENDRRKVISAHRDLLELFDASVHAFRHRVAFRMIEGELESRFTYGEVHKYATRIGRFLQDKGVDAGERVMLISENRPEWGMSFFGILKAHATVVPIDSTLSEAEVINIARRCDAKVCLLSEQAIERLPHLHQGLSQAELSTQLFSIAQAMTAVDVEKAKEIPSVTKATDASSIASLIFTSGTTGQPKGVMLTHRNFTSLVSKLATTFHLGPGDGLLSVLPLHHTFEFSSGFLMPFSQGAEISYLDELTSDRLGQVLETGRITSMMGVPALWQLLHRKMTQELASKPAWIETSVRALMSAHGELRHRSAMNVGKLLFWPVHRKFGGKIKYLVSGGSALSEDIQKAFHELGFQMSEGYGLTEAAPVLTVASPSEKRPEGSVGKALPGIEISIHQPDENGVGEVLAKGPNVMAGYFKDEEATSAVLKNGWLHTGDLGRLDEDGHLFLVGRQKDVIIDANGKNVFPDELEPLYQNHSLISELSIVGLPEGTGKETIACLCVPKYEGSSREEVRLQLEEHFRKISSTLPFYRRVKVLKFFDGELPKTSTRKVKRPLVVAELQRQDRVSALASKAPERSGPENENHEWLRALISAVCGKPVSDISAQSQLVADLGFDSLMMTELAAALEQAHIPTQHLGDLTTLQTVENLSKALASVSKNKPSQRLNAEASRPEEASADSPEIPIPEWLSTFGRKVLSAGQKALYENLFQVETTGHNFIPQNRNFLVVANHTSHLDMGVVKLALAEQGDRLTALAAKDYFFNTPLKRAYFENFTHLIPMDRSGSLRESLRLAGEALNQGYHLLIFPEGTRSPNGKLQEFKPTLGYLALTFGVDVLPLYIRGAYEALPKGAMLPKSHKLSVHIGPPLEVSQMRKQVHGLARSDSYRYVTQLAETAVRSLEGGRILNPETQTAVVPTRRQKRSGGSES